MSEATKQQLEQIIFARKTGRMTGLEFVQALDELETVEQQPVVQLLGISGKCIIAVGALSRAN